MTKARATSAAPLSESFRVIGVEREDGLRWAPPSFEYPASRPHGQRFKVCTVFGTRPEMIKLAPIIHRLEAAEDVFQIINVASGQHADLIDPFIRFFGIRLDHNLRVMEPGQTPNQVCARVLAALDPILTAEAPDLLLVQGDTSTALAGALAGFHQGIPVGHVEAGLRSGNTYSPFPEEMNRRLITRLATYHFASTRSNRDSLLDEGVAAESVFVTGNPVVDSLQSILEQAAALPTLQPLYQATEGMKRLVLTLHRRENFGERLVGYLDVLRRFVERREDVVLIFPVHPNPCVRGPVQAALAGHPRIHLLEPLDYLDFIGLLSKAWLIASDSGGVQEEAPTLGKALLVLRENTERPEALESGIARLVGPDPRALACMLEEVYLDDAWAKHACAVENPFGQGDSGKRIVEIISTLYRNREAGIRNQESASALTTNSLTRDP
jgi:UDP-N-acetylglucosamine 2-epimerase (non-hydrolysing)